MTTKVIHNNNSTLPTLRPHSHTSFLLQFQPIQLNKPTKNKRKRNTSKQPSTKPQRMSYVETSSYIRTHPTYEYGASMPKALNTNSLSATCINFVLIQPNLPPISSCFKNQTWIFINKIYWKK